MTPFLTPIGFSIVFIVTFGAFLLKYLSYNNLLIFEKELVRYPFRPEESYFWAKKASTLYNTQFYLSDSINYTRLFKLFKIYLLYDYMCPDLDLVFIWVFHRNAAFIEKTQILLKDVPELKQLGAKKKYLLDMAEKVARRTKSNRNQEWFFSHYRLVNFYSTIASLFPFQSKNKILKWATKTKEAENLLVARDFIQELFLKQLLIELAALAVISAFLAFLLTLGLSHVANVDLLPFKSHFVQT